MPRNLDTRVELVTPVEDPALRDGPARHARALAGRRHQRVGPRRRRHLGAPAHAAGAEPRSVQRELMLGHAARAAEGATAATDD